MGIDPITASLGIAAVQTGLGLFGASRKKKDAKKAQKQELAFEAKSAKLESVALLEEAALQAIEIRREGEQLGKSQTAFGAKAGLKIGEGTAKDIREETERLTEKDVATTKSSAERKGEQLMRTYGVPEPERKHILAGGKVAEDINLFNEFGDPLRNDNFIKSKNTTKKLFSVG